MPVSRRSRAPVLSTALLTAAFLVLGPPPTLTPSVARAQEDIPPEEAQRASDAAFRLGKKQLRRGAYFDALEDLEEALEFQPNRADVRIAMAEAHAEMGEIEKALEMLQRAGDVALAYSRKAALLIDAGRLEEATVAVERALEIDESHVPGYQLRGVIQEQRGEREAALGNYELANKTWARNDTDTADDLLAVARARLGVYRLSDEYKVVLQSVLERLGEALEQDKERNDVQVEIGMLYLNQYRDSFAKERFKKVETRNPQYAPALYALGLQRAFRYDSDGAKEFVERAIRANPKFVPAHVYLAQVELGDSNLDQADKHIAAALAVNPRHLEARGAQAASLYLRGDKAGFEKAAKEIRALNRHAGDAYSVLAHALEEQRRFAEALEMALQATKLDETDADMWFLAGRNAMNVGRDKDSKTYLEKSEKIDVFKNIYRSNFLELFKKLEGFPVRKDDRFVVKLPPAEEAPYYRLLQNGLDWSIDLLEKKWGFVPEKPLFVSVFDQQNDFATRTIGLPGFPALGACFGRVVTLDSPRALPPGAFGWRGTMHHELAHVITLELSRGRVPRWLTEGISVYEERKVTPVWNREMERVLASAIASDDVLTLAQINNAFRGSRVMFAYYQGGLMCELIERDFGFDKLREMVRLYGEGKQTPQVVREALGVEPEEFDRQFLAYAKDFVKDMKVLRSISPKKLKSLKRSLRRNKKDLDGHLLYAEGKIAEGKSSDALASLGAAVKLAPKDPRIPLLRSLISFRENRPDKGVEYGQQAIAGGADLFDLRMALAAHFLAQGSRDMGQAKAHLRKAIELWPTVTGGNSPRLQLARLLMGEGEEALPEAIGLLRDHVGIAEDDFGTRLQLADYYFANDQVEDELAMREQIRDVVPLPNLPKGGGPPGMQAAGWGREQAAELHERLGRIYLDRKRYADAELAFHTAVEVARMPLGAGGIADSAYLSDLLTGHAEALRFLGKADEARAKARSALRADPENDAAQDLLDQLGS